MAELPSTLPFASSALLSTYTAAALTYTLGVVSVAVVSKPLFGTVASGVSVVGDSPASSCHDATSVAPFQLVWTVTLEAPRVAAIAGGVVGCPLHGDR